ncbi:unnamed protein product [Eruca vesicaria subsp. sativa]|uniref:Uncharacterized protein n=1 Tax=Eruca vesicaria subsp. sativa TaxID=29727 RepID=A0ABC8JQE2_ERUVS|nr:unnamed protein product [Eruca vesicaria subsp. sativa]
MGEVRDAMLIYTKSSDPTESAARRERMRQAEEQGEMEQAAIAMVKANQVVETELVRPDQGAITPERIPAILRLGPVEASKNSSMERIPATLRLGSGGSAEQHIHQEREREEAQDLPVRIPATLRLGTATGDTAPPESNEPLLVQKRKPGQKSLNKNLLR